MKRYLILAVIAIGTVAFVACSAVNFSNVPKSQSSGCTVSNPCANPNGSNNVTQTVSFSNSNKVDILVIDDNSSSMTVEQANLGSAFNGFISNLNAAGLDWQIAVTNTDVCPSSTAPAGFCPGPSGIPGANGSFMGPLGAALRYSNQYILSSAAYQNNLSAAQAQFSAIIQRFGEIGSGDERPINAANLVLDKSSGEDAALFRPNSNFVVVILSDEDERSVAMRDPTDPSYAVFENYDYVQTLLNKFSSMGWSTPKQMQIDSIVINPNDTSLYPDPNQGNALTTCLDLQAHQGPTYTAHPGMTLATAALSTTGGQVGSICNDGNGAFAQMLKNVAGAISTLPTSNVIALNYIPATVPTLTFSNGMNIPFTWQQGSSQITLQTRPAPGVTVTISYSYFTAAQQNYMQPQGGRMIPFGIPSEPPSGLPFRSSD